MQILIEGKCTAISKKELRYAIKFFANMLMTKRLSDSLSIEVSYEKDRDPLSHASMTWLDKNVRPKVYDIEINPNMGKRRILIALAHEMVHIKQYAKGEMKDYVSRKKFRRVIQWQTKDVSCDTFYWERPWEIEAYGRELGLYEMYKAEVRDNKLKF